MPPRRNDFADAMRRVATAFVLIAACVVSPARLAAQSVTLGLSATLGDSTSPAPNMTVTGFEDQPERGPYTVSIALSFEPQFRVPFYTNFAQAEAARFTLPSLMPERSTVYFRARLVDRSGVVVAETIQQHPVRGWLKLISPLRGPTTIVTTRTPRFIWSSPAITLPPGLWIYDLQVINTRTGNVAFSKPDLTDTSWVFPDTLESSASYRWQVHAHTQAGLPTDQVTVSSEGTFVIAAAPTATIFYPNFPNPFGAGTRSDLTCFWFDLARPASVKLTIYDIRLHEVRRIIPSSSLPGNMGTGPYGRENVDLLTGCDTRFAWDGRDSRGQFVLKGIYIAVFEADGVRQLTKIDYRGP